MPHVFVFDSVKTQNIILEIKYANQLSASYYQLFRLINLQSEPNYYNI